MDFSLSAITAPFRMQPGLRRIGSGEVRLHALDPAGALAAGKRAVLQAGQALHQVPGFDAGPALRAITRQARQQGLAVPPRDLTADELAMAFEEDFAVLDARSGTVPWMCVCVPSHWAPEDKIGLGLAALHAPVADGQALVRAADALVALVTGGDCWQRHVWTITPSAQHDQHPRRHGRMPWPADDDPGQFASRCHLRVEQQSFFPSGTPGQAVFAIRVMVAPLMSCVHQPTDAQALHAALGSMSPAVLEYKGLAPARARLLAWLQAT